MCHISVFLCIPLYLKQENEVTSFFSFILHQHIVILPLLKIFSSLWFFNCCCTEVYCKKEMIKWSNLLSYSNFCSLLHRLWDQYFMRTGIVLMMGREAAAKKQILKISCYPFLLFFHVWWLCRITRLLQRLEELTWYSSLDRIYHLVVSLVSIAKLWITLKCLYD